MHYNVILGMEKGMYLRHWDFLFVGVTEATSFGPTWTEQLAA